MKLYLNFEDLSLILFILLGIISLELRQALKILKFFFEVLFLKFLGWVFIFISDGEELKGLFSIRFFLFFIFNFKFILINDV